MYSYYLTIVLAPLAAAIVAGLAGKKIGRAGAHSVTIFAVGLTLFISTMLMNLLAQWVLVHTREKYE